MRADPIALGGWQRRERTLNIAVVGIFALVLLRLFVLQVLEGSRYRELSEENRIRVEVLTAPRGEIRDRKGRLLADCVPSFTVTLDPFDKSYTRAPARLDSTLRALGPILDVDPADLRDKIQRERKISFLPIRLKRNVDLKTVAFVSEHRDRLPGVQVESEPLRRYPLGDMGSHLLGYVGEISDKELADPAYGDYLSGDLIGRMGIERKYEKLLRGQDGKRFVEVNALGRKGDFLGEKHPVLPKRGTDLTLTIDLDVQRAAENAFEAGARGAVVAIDPRNGEVLALASKPNYDPNEFSTGITQERWNELSSGGNYPLFNRAGGLSARLHAEALHGARGARGRGHHGGNLLRPDLHGRVPLREPSLRLLEARRAREPRRARRHRPILRCLLLPARPSDRPRPPGRVHDEAGSLGARHNCRAHQYIR